MSDQPTLDGLTADQMLRICEQAAHRDIKARIAAHPAMQDRRPLGTSETACLNIGVTSGVHAAITELARRGLIKDRP
jgi:hypothetical protein